MVDSVCFTIVTVSPVKILRYFMPASSNGRITNASCQTSLPNGRLSGCCIRRVKNLGATTSAMESPDFLENEQTLLGVYSK